MSDKETKERIEKEARDYVDQNNHIAHKETCYIAGAESERPKAWNEAIDECIKKQLLIVKPGTISKKDKDSLTKNGYLLIEHPFPGDIRVINDLDVDGSVLLSAAMGTIRMSGNESVKAGFFNRVNEKLYPEPSKKSQ